MWQHKAEWIRQLKVGDRVCDCNYDHLKIVAITDEYFPWRPWFFWLVFHLSLPSKVLDWYENIWYAICAKMGWKELMDRSLTLEGGRQCSANHCCDPVEHEWNHIIKGKTNGQSKTEQEN